MCSFKEKTEVFAKLLTFNSTIHTLASFPLSSIVAVPYAMHENDFKVKPIQKNFQKFCIQNFSGLDGIATITLETCASEHAIPYLSVAGFP